MRRSLLTILLALPFVPSIPMATSTPPQPAHGQEDLEHILRLDGADSPAARIEDLAWLEGHWRAKALGGVCEETWSSPAGGAMTCMFRCLQNDKVSFYEFCTLREHEGSLTFRLKHFHEDLRGWETRDEFVEFPLVEIDEEGAWFDGLTILRDGPDRMSIYVALGEGDEIQEVHFDYRRSPTR